MATNLTAAETDDNVTVPDEGEEVDATTLGLGKGPVRRGYQALLNQIHRIRRGRVTLRGIHVVAPGGADVPAPADGEVTVLGIIKAAALLGAGHPAIQVLLGDIVATNGNLIGQFLQLTGIDPAKTAAVTNLMVSGDVPKARGRITTDGAGAVAMLDGKNVLAVSLATYGGGPNHVIRVTFAANMLDLNYHCIVSASAVSSALPIKAAMVSGADITNFPTLAHFDIRLEGDPTSIAYDLSFEVKGLQ